MTSLPLHPLFPQGDDDDDIGALGSILSWDEDEDNANDVATGHNQAQSGRDSSGASALPDLVSFGAKDGGLNSAYLQQLLDTNGNIVPGATEVKNGNGSPHLAIPMPMPTRIDFGNTGSRSAHAQVQQQQTPSVTHQNATNLQQQSNGTNTGQQKPAAVQNAQPAAGQQQAGSGGGNPQMTQPIQQQQQNQGASNVQQQLPMTVNQLLQQASNNANMFPQAAFPFFQQGALLAQNQQGQVQPQQTMSMPSAMSALMMQSVAAMAQDRRTEQQPQAQSSQQVQPAQQQQQAQQQMPQFTFTTDPNAFIRQLQVAQLQQQFNAVQQARPAPQQIAPGSGTQTPSQQQPQPPLAFPSSQIAVPTTQPAASQGQNGSTAQVQSSLQVQAPAPAALPAPTAAKKGRGASKKPRASSKGKDRSNTTADPAFSVARAPLVSASDTDGEPSFAVVASAVKAKGSKSSDGQSKPSSIDNIDMSEMTSEEKAKANRDRNREHARNTRLRKKAYLEKLKTTVDSLCRERDSLVADRAGAANILVEMHNTRTEVLMSFFALRSANEKRRELWSSILDESCFACVIPVTPYRSFPASEVQVSKCQRTILGIDGMMSDTASLHVLLNSLVDRSRFPNATITFRYTLVTEEAVVAGNQMMARWVMSTLNATQCGARTEITKQGMLCCKFNSSHKIIGLELMFDVMALMLQLNQAAGSDTFSVIPNTVQTCQRSFNLPMVMTLAEEPYTIVQVNKLWEEMSGYSADEVVGKSSCQVLEGEETDPAAVEALMNEIRFKRPASAMVVNYRKPGGRFRNFFLAFPLSTDSRISHYLFLSNTVTSCGLSNSPDQESSQKDHLAQSFAAAASGGGANMQYRPIMLGGVETLSSTLTSSERASTQPSLSNPLIPNIKPGTPLQTNPTLPGFTTTQQQQLQNANPLKRAGDAGTNEAPSKNSKRYDTKDNG